MSDKPTVIRVGRRAGKLAILGGVAAVVAGAALTPQPQQLDPTTGQPLAVRMDEAPTPPPTTQPVRSQAAEQQILARQVRKLLRRQRRGRGKVRGSWLPRMYGGKLVYVARQYPKTSRWR